MTINMPLTDIAGFITGLAVNFSYSRCLGIQWLVVIKQSVSKPVLPGQQTPAIRSTYRTARYRIREINALFLEII